jgi:2-dehydropantoate 2-reductase
LKKTATAPHYRWLVFGAGAIGSYVGGSLAAQGQQVVFLERQEGAVILGAKGLRLQLEGQERLVPDVNVAGSVEEALAWGPYDIAIFAIKSYDTPAALQELGPFARDLPPFLCLQNGVENEAYLGNLLGNERVIAGAVTSAIGKLDPGDIILERLRGVGVAGGNPLAPGLVQAMSAAGLNARLYEDAARMKWSKLLTNLLANATSAILDMPPAQIFEDPGLFQVEIQQLREALQVMAGLGLKPIDLPGTPVRLLAFLVRYLNPHLSQPLLKRAIGRGRGEKMPSFHIDLHSGRGRSEVEFLNGAVVRFGEKLNIPTPVNKVLTNTLLALTRGEKSVEEIAHQPDKLLALL